MTSTATSCPTPTQKEVKNQKVAKKSSNLTFVLLWGDKRSLRFILNQDFINKIVPTKQFLKRIPIPIL